MIQTTSLSNKSFVFGLLGPMDSAWPTFGYDNQHTCQSPFNTRDNPMEIKWKFATDLLGFESSPVIDQEGVLYIGCNYNLYAINPDGTEKWRYNIHGGPSDSAALSEDGTIYIGSMDDHLYAINPDGTMKWRFQAAKSIWGSPTVGSDGTVYFGITGPDIDSDRVGRVYALNPDGTEKWYFDTNDYVYSTPALSSDGTIYITSNDQYLYAMYPNNGSMMWRYKTGAGDPAIGYDGTIYVPSHDNYLYAINSDGTLQWRTEIGYGSSDCPAIGNDGTIYIGEEYFYAVNPDGTIKWIYEGWENHEYEVTSSAYAISADGLVYFVATKGSGHGGDLFVLNCDDGSLHNQIRIAPDGYQYAQPVIGGDGTVYVGSQFSGNPQGFLYAFGTSGENHRPDKPDIDGPLTGQPGVSYQYSFTVTDIDDDQIYLFVDWGDGSDSDWIGPYNNDDIVTLEHSWESKGSFSLKARAMDEQDAVGEWALYPVTMPKSKTILNVFLELMKVKYPLFDYMFNRLLDI